MAQRTRGRQFHWLFVLPLLALVVGFYLLPAIITVPVAFTDMDRSLRWNWVGWKNFARIAGLRDFLLPAILRNTVIYVVGGLGIAMLLSLAIAFLSTSVKPKAGAFFRALWFLPRATPTVVWGYLWISTFEPTRYGLLNSLMRTFGLPARRWLSDYPLLIVILAGAFLTVPYCMTILAAALSAIPKEYEEAARIDGATEPQIALFVKMPLLKWPLAFLTIWYTLAFLTEFEYILIITAGGPFYASTTLSLYIYEKAFKYFSIGQGAALAFVLILLCMVFIGLYWKLFGLQRSMVVPGSRR